MERTIAKLAGIGLIAWAGCGGSGLPVDSTSLGQGVSEKKLDIGICAPDAGGFTLESTNPYFPIEVGLRWVLAGEEDGEEVVVRITVLDETEEVAGVVTRVVEECEWIDGEVVEISRNFFVERNETICYFGEDVDVLENGEIEHPGAWRAGGDNEPGIIMPAAPFPGVKYLNEVAPGIAEDEAKIVGAGPASVPYGDFDLDETIRVREFNPLDGDLGFKVFAADVGLIVDGPAELVSFETVASPERCQFTDEPPEVEPATDPTSLRARVPVIEGL